MTNSLGQVNVYFVSYTFQYLHMADVVCDDLKQRVAGPAAFLHTTDVPDEVEQCETDTLVLEDLFLGNPRAVADLAESSEDLETKRRWGGRIFQDYQDVGQKGHHGLHRLLSA